PRSRHGHRRGGAGDHAAGIRPGRGILPGPAATTPAIVRRPAGSLGNGQGTTDKGQRTTRMIWLDYFLFLLPGMALSMWAQARIMGAYAGGSRIPAGSGLSGAETAQLVMRAGGVLGVGIEPVAGELSDHYDPRNKVLRLSREVYAGRSLAAMGVAAHEAGHAVQDAPGDPRPGGRQFIVPLASPRPQV